MVAQLIKGGLKARMYMVSYGGCDTHLLQTNTTDTTTGVYAKLAGNVSAAIKAFMDDVKFLRDEYRMEMTFSEFAGASNQTAVLVRIMVPLYPCLFSIQMWFLVLQTSPMQLVKPMLKVR